MLLKVTQGVQHYRWAEILEPVVESDLVMQTNDVWYLETTKEICCSVSVTIPQSKISWNEISGLKSSRFVRHFARKVRYNGLKTTQARKEKYDRLCKEIIADRNTWASKYAVAYALSQFNEELERRVRSTNQSFSNAYSRYLCGQGMDETWIAETLDSDYTKTELQKVNEEIAALKKRRKALHGIRKTERNINMLQKMTKDNWEVKEEDNSKVTLPKPVIERLTKIYSNGEAFSDSMFGVIH